MKPQALATPPALRRSGQPQALATHPAPRRSGKPQLRWSVAALEASAALKSTVAERSSSSLDHGGCRVHFAHAWPRTDTADRQLALQWPARAAADGTHLSDPGMALSLLQPQDRPDAHKAQAAGWSSVGTGSPLPLPPPHIPAQAAWLGTGTAWLVRMGSNPQRWAQAGHELHLSAEF